MPTTQGADALGRVFNVVPVCTAGGAISLSQGQAISFVITGATAVPTLTIATSFGGTYRAANFFTPNWAPISRVYWQVLTAGANAWTKTVITAAATYTHGTTTGTPTMVTATASVFTIFGTQLPDTYNYIKCTVTGSGIGSAIVTDLGVQRTPANLAALSA